MNDTGAIIGSFAMGIISDLTWGKRSPVAMFAVIASAAIFYTMTFTYESINYWEFIVYFLFFGIFLQGVNNTISSVCSADIGRSSGRAKNVTSTVTGIIDGTGSIGSSIAMYTVGALKNSFTNQPYKWGFLMPVSICCTVCMIPIAIVLNKECKQISDIRKQQNNA
jgi:sugar phosphate permease